MWIECGRAVPREGVLKPCEGVCLDDPPVSDSPLEHWEWTTVTTYYQREESALLSYWWQQKEWSRAAESPCLVVVGLGLGVASWLVAFGRVLGPMDGAHKIEVREVDVLHHHRQQENRGCMNWRYRVSFR